MLSNTDNYLLQWYFIAENHDFYESWKKDFLADLPPELAYMKRMRTGGAVESTAPTRASDPDGQI